MARREETGGADLAARGWQRWWSWWAGRRRGGPVPRAARRVVAALLITAGGVLAVLPARAAEGSAVAVVLDDLPAGAVITAAMVADRSVATPPDGAVVADQAIGHTLAGPVRRGELLTDARLVAVDGPDPGPDRVAVPVRLDDPGVVALLRPGLHVAVLAVNAEAAERPSLADSPDPDTPDPDTPDGATLDGAVPGGDTEPPATADATAPPSVASGSRNDGLVTMLAADAVVLTVPSSAGSAALRASAGAGTVLIAVPDEAADTVAAYAALGAVTIRFT